MTPNVHFTTYWQPDRRMIVQPDRRMVLQPRSDATQKKNIKNLTYTWHPDRSLLSLYSALLLNYYCITLALSGCATSAHVPPRMITLTPSRYHPPTCLLVVWSQHFYSTRQVSVPSIFQICLQSFIIKTSSVINVRSPGSWRRSTLL